MTQRKEGRQQSHVSPAFNFPHMLAGPREKPVLSAKAASKIPFPLCVPVCQSAFSHCDKIPEIHLERKKGLLWLMVSEFSPWLTGSVSSEPVVRQNIRVEHVAEETCSPRGGQEAKREGKDGIPTSPSRA
jgi:hypothetical protein